MDKPDQRSGAVSCMTSYQCLLEALNQSWITDDDGGGGGEVCSGHLKAVSDPVLLHVTLQATYICSFSEHMYVGCCYAMEPAASCLVVSPPLL